MTDLQQIARLSRAFERAVLASSAVGGSPIVLDRSLDSLARLDEYFSAMDPAGLATPNRLAMLTAYLQMVRASQLGEAGTLEDPGPARAAADRLRGVPLTTYADELRRQGSTPVLPSPRERVVTLQVLVPTTTEWDSVRPLVLDFLPALAGASELFEDDGAVRLTRLIGDSDELRVDLEPDEDGEEASLTIVFLVEATQDERELVIDAWSALAPLSPVFAVAYQADTLEGFAYLSAGLRGALPQFLLFSREAARRAGGLAAVVDAPCDAQLLADGTVLLRHCGSASGLTSLLTLLSHWPHLESDPLPSTPKLAPVPPPPALPPADAEAVAAVIRTFAGVFSGAVAAWEDPAFDIGWTVADFARVDAYLSAHRRDVPSGADPSLMPIRALSLGAYLFEVLIDDGGYEPIYADPPTASRVRKGEVEHSPWLAAWERLTLGKPLAGWP
jgi:hypothetical protein